MRVHKVRFEGFGGIVGTADPPGLYWVDRRYLQERGYHGGAAWAGPASPGLSGPVEMEIAVTTRCNLACGCCYTDARPGGGEVPTFRVEAALEAAAGLGVFHVAFGGGEPLLHPELLDLARRARELGLLPSLTTNGTLVDPNWARAAATVFARVNVSVDLPGGPRDGRAVNSAWAAVRRLRREGVTAGVNYVVTRRNLDRLGEVFRLARQAGADSLLVLRPKPGGRGTATYPGLALSLEQARTLLGRLGRLAVRHRLHFHLDCALAPLLISRPVSRPRLVYLGARGCIAGDLLLTVDAAGMVAPCSHLPPIGRLEDLPGLWQDSPRLAGLRERLPAGCSGCPNADLCRGGCAAVAALHGELPHASDPDLPCTGCRIS